MGSKTEAVTPWIPNATWEEKPKRSSLKLERVVDMIFNTATWEGDKVVRPGITLVGEGWPGTGKTMGTAAIIRGKGATPVIENVSVLMPNDWSLMVPRLRDGIAHGASDAALRADPDSMEEIYKAAQAMVAQTEFILETTLASKLIHDEPWVLVLDELNRVQRAMLPVFMEILVDKTLLGRSLPNLVGIMGLRNPPGEGFLGISTGDLAFESRFPVFRLSERDIPWREALAQKYHDTDLKPLFEAYRTLDATARRTFSPSVVDGAIAVTLAGLPTEVALPILPSGRLKIKSAAGDNVTEAIMKLTAEALGCVHRTADTFPNLAVTALMKSLEMGWNAHLVGPHGSAKTAFIRSILEAAGLPNLIISAAMADPSTFVQLVPMKGKVVAILSDRLSFESEGVLVLDEYTLAPKNVKPQLLEVAGPTRSIAGVPLNVKAVWALDNPARFGAVQYTNRSADEAMVRRFVVNLEVTEEDFPWREYLESKYGADVVKPFAEWRSQDLNPDERPLVPPRTLEIMIQVHLNGLDVDEALPYLGNDRIPIRTNSLKARLGNKELLGLAAVVADAANQIDLLGDEDADQVAKSNARVSVMRAFQKAELRDLVPHRRILVDFINVLPRDSRTAIITAAQAEKAETGQKKVQFWAFVYGWTQKDVDETEFEEAFTKVAEELGL